MIDKESFERRGGKGSTDSFYIACRTACCGNVGVQDLEQYDFYYDPADLTKVASVYYDHECPFCSKYKWELSEISNESDLPIPWAWATKK